MRIELEESHVAVTGTFLEPQLARWREVSPQTRWRLPSEEPLRAGLPRAFFDQLPWGVVRVAHPRWIYDAIEGRGAQRLRLAEFVGMAGLDPSAADVRALLRLEELAGLRGLDLTSMPVEEVAWERVAEQAAWRDLEVLTLEYVDVETRRRLEATGLFHGVRRVCVRSRYPYDLDAIGRTLASEMFANVEEVCVEGLHGFDGLARALRDPGALPSLRTFVLTSGSGSLAITDDEDALGLISRSVERLRLVCGPPHPWFVKNLCTRSFDGLRVLDLSGVGCLEVASGHERMQARRLVQAHLPGSVLAGSLERIELGRLATAPLVDRLQGDGIGVEGW